LALAGLCALYLLTGLVGHDPWKNDDAIHFGVVYGFLHSQDWLVPRLAGETYLETPPLYYWVAAVCAKMFGGWLPLHDAVRLASGLFGALFLYLLAFASRILHDLESARLKPTQGPERRESGAAATLVAIGCLGLLVPIHDTQPMVALLAASAAAYAGFALLLLRPIAGGVLAGLGLGLGFLASGLMILVTLVPLLLLLPLNRHWRNRTGLAGIAVALLVALPLCAIWPLLLLGRSPDMFHAWWSLASAGVGYQSGWPKAIPDHLELLAWFAWPALPLALWALWLKRKDLGQPALLLPLAGSLTALGCLLMLYGPRPLLAFPVLVPLILLATGSASRLRRGATNAFDWFGMMTFTLIAGLIWLGGIAMTSGIPTQIAHNFSKLEPGFVSRFSWPAYAGAMILSLLWLWLIFASPRSPWRAVTHWAAGTTLAWALLTTLWMPWIDYGKSYRGMAVSLKQAIVAAETIQHPAEDTPRCIAGRRLGAAQRVSLEYFAAIVTLRQESKAGRTCRLLLEQGSERGDPTPPGWLKIWEGHRPGDRSERLRLYRRET
jgi:4-amino-4-deoxy-L-arabinose transferase-like glycosyltransferase